MTTTCVRMKGVLQKIVDVRAGRSSRALAGFVFHFLVLGGYYVIKPIRDSIGAERRRKPLPWMFTGDAVAMLIANTLSPPSSRGCRGGNSFRSPIAFFIRESWSFSSC